MQATIVFFYLKLQFSIQTCLVRLVILAKIFIVTTRC